ncbi:MAG: hypothetical protein H0Z24_05875 [Thermosipho sp. (in: Bacteria)]|nr:hypothetical protein [Thermosipho sp. (in: thermotogales)]
MADKVKCQYCGKFFSEKGIKKHEKSCYKNPLNANKNEEVIIIDEDKKEEEVKVLKKLEKQEQETKKEEVTLVVNTKKPVEPKKVKIKTKKYHRCHIGGNWYEFFPDKVYTVPVNVKEILLRANILMPL